MTTFSPPGKKSCLRERPCRKAAHERHEEKDGCPYFEDACPFLCIHRPQRCGAASPGPSPSGGKKWRLRFRRTWCLPLGLLLGCRDAAPYKGALRMRRAFPFRSSKAPSPIPSPGGGGCRPQGRQERENAAGPRRGNDRGGGEKQRFCRLLAVAFSLFRHPPRGGSADATFPRWGKEMAESTQRPCRGRRPDAPAAVARFP